MPYGKKIDNYTFGRITGKFTGNCLNRKHLFPSGNKMHEKIMCKLTFAAVFSIFGKILAKISRVGF
jgi:hypothetical protein